MTERELFQGFYALARLDLQTDKPFAHDFRLVLAAEAARAGLSNYQILMARNAALLAIVDRKMSHREPSRNSVAIQLSVHTFGRVTRGRA